MWPAAPTAVMTRSNCDCARSRAPRRCIGPAAPGRGVKGDRAACLQGAGEGRRPGPAGWLGVRDVVLDSTPFCAIAAEVNASGITCALATISDSLRCYKIANLGLAAGEVARGSGNAWSRVSAFLWFGRGPAWVRFWVFTFPRKFPPPFPGSFPGFCFFSDRIPPRQIPAGQKAEAIEGDFKMAERTRFEAIDQLKRAGFIGGV